MRGFISELRRRNVFRVAIAYVVVAWLLAQVAELALDSFEAPAWVIKTILLLLALGLPIALLFAWAFELTPEGLKKEKDVVRSQSITAQTGHKLDMMIIGVLGVTVAFLLLDRFLLQPNGITASDTVQAPDRPVREALANSIAVLPFVDMSPGRDQEYFTDGLTENLLHALAQVAEIKVTGRTSSFAFKGLNEDLRSIGEKLNVRHILEGSVQKAGQRVRITTQLVDTEDGFHLWSQTFDRRLDDIFEVQDEIAAAVVKALRKSVLGEPAPVTSAYAGSAEAYNAYLMGQAFANRHNFEGWELAIEQYRRAIEIDPNMALAWAGLSEAISDQTGFTSGFAEGYQQAREAAEKAIELDPALPEGYLALADVQRANDWDWAGVGASLRKALSLRPADPDIRTRLAELKAMLGDPRGALMEVETVLAQDPLNDSINRMRIWLLLALRRNDEALAAAQHLMDTDRDRGGTGTVLASAYHQRGEYEKALAAARQEVFPFLRLTMEAIALESLGEAASARDKLEELMTTYGEDVSYQVAAIHAEWGEKDEAFEALERGYAIRDPGLVWIRLHGAFDPLRDDPRYDELLARMGMR